MSEMIPIVLTCPGVPAKIALYSLKGIMSDTTSSAGGGESKTNPRWRRFIL